MSAKIRPLARIKILLLDEGSAMANYKEMYTTLFRETTKAIEILQRAQQDAEEMYIAAPEPDIRMLDVPKPAENTTEVTLQKD